MWKRSLSLSIDYTRVIETTLRSRFVKMKPDSTRFRRRFNCWNELNVRGALLGQQARMEHQFWHLARASLPSHLIDQVQHPRPLPSRLLSRPLRGDQRLILRFFLQSLRSFMLHRLQSCRQVIFHLELRRSGRRHHQSLLTEPALFFKLRPECLKQHHDPSKHRHNPPSRCYLHAPRSLSQKMEVCLHSLRPPLLEH